MKRSKEQLARCTERRAPSSQWSARLLTQEARRGASLGHGGCLSSHGFLVHWCQVLGQALLAENQANAEGMRYLQVRSLAWRLRSLAGGVGHLQGVGRLCGAVAGTPTCVSCRNHLSSAHFALANGYFTRGDLEDGLSHAREEGSKSSHLHLKSDRC